MRRIIVRYKVKEGHAEENVELVEKVYAELAETPPEGLRYATFVGDDGLSFIHFASIETTDGVNPLDESPAFNAFQEGIKGRCEIPPEALPLKEVGSYNFFDS